MLKNKTSLQIRQLELHVNLGWRKKERGKEQAVFLDLDIFFPSMPKACLTDELDDTFCYAKLIEHLREKISEKSYRLIEHLCRDIYQHAKNFLETKSNLRVCITKYPNIPGLGHVSFCYEDE